MESKKSKSSSKKPKTSYKAEPKAESKPSTDVEYKPSPKPVKKAPKVELITFRDFFAFQVHIKRVRPEQEAEILAFFKDHNLKLKEPKSVYLSTLEKY